MAGCHYADGREQPLLQNMVRHPCCRYAGVGGAGRVSLAMRDSPWSRLCSFWCWTLTIWPWSVHSEIPTTEFVSRLHQGQLSPRTFTRSGRLVWAWLWLGGAWVPFHMAFLSPSGSHHSTGLAAHNSLKDTDSFGRGGIMTQDLRNVFISHVHEDDEGLPRLKDLVARHGMIAVMPQSLPANSTRPAMKNTSSTEYSSPASNGPASSWCTYLPRPKQRLGKLGNRMRPPGRKADCWSVGVGR